MILPVRAMKYLVAYGDRHRWEICPRGILESYVMIQHEKKFVCQSRTHVLTVLGPVPPKLNDVDLWNKVSQ